MLSYNCIYINHIHSLYLNIKISFLYKASNINHKKYGKCNGKLQEKEGPYIAKPILRKLGFDENVIERVCYLIVHHHTYTNVDGIDYQILLEADFLVNILEDDLSSKASVNVLANVFKTKTGIEFFNSMYSQWKVNIE
ncbi:hypothetical protein [Clostridium sp. Marseille-Q2269]|uniref:hypothetical protein n=1 Tax=Clostridium sp. Marseille-Q2269 TaxID=2942205 RepID=UPI002074434A|nr:hypothetical protein [Clostridium sp. Marseille-Q2269]